jgi:hypothetical protein
MRRKLSSAALVVAMVIAGCSAGGGHAERVDVPLRLGVTMTKRSTSDCHQGRCRLHVKAVVARR